MNEEYQSSPIVMSPVSLYNSPIKALMASPQMQSRQSQVKQVFEIRIFFTIFLEGTRVTNHGARANGHFVLHVFNQSELMGDDGQIKITYTVRKLVFGLKI